MEKKGIVKVGTVTVVEEQKISEKVRTKKRNKERTKKINEEIERRTKRINQKGRHQETLDEEIRVIYHSRKLQERLEETLSISDG